MHLSTKHVEAGARELTALAVCALLLFASQTALAAIPNVEIVSLLIILYTLYLGRKTLLVIVTFAVLEGLLYGFSLWWPMYLYVWPILWLLVTLAGRRPRSPRFWAAVGGCFGLAYGFLCSPFYAAMSGVRTAVAWWVAGIPFDLIHGAGNFLLILCLFRPLDALFGKLKRWYLRGSGHPKT